MKVLEKFPRSVQLRNYASHPDIDVEILEPGARHCEACAAEVIYDRDAGYGGRWVHAAPAAECSYARPLCRCVYCGVEDGQDGAAVKFRQHAWYDAVECDRCGGVDGYAIGD